MLKYLNSIPSNFKEKLNHGIMNRDYDRDLVEYIVDAFRGLEVMENVKIVGYEWDPQEDNYNVNDHVIRRNRNRNKVIKNITETRCGVLYIDASISGFDNNNQRKIVLIKKPIIIPIQDKHGYFLIRGKKNYVIYQLLDKISYPSIGAVTVKSLMPICVKTAKESITELHSNIIYTVPVYNIQIFKNPINVLLVYSHIAINKMLNFLEVRPYIRLLELNSYTPKPDKLYFGCGKKSNVVIEADQKRFDKFVYVRSITGCLIKLIEETKVPFEDLNNRDNWMAIVGGKGTVRRGEFQHTFFNRLIDDVTRLELKVNVHDKQNIYYLLRWLLQNYHTLWAKDNLSMVNKRLRCNEYLGSLMTAEISRRINRLVSLGDKAKLSDYLLIFKFPEDIFISKLHSSGILRYAENNNDIDMFSKFTVTKKGPQSLGVSDGKRIPIRQRLLHPSMVGSIDISSTSNSDPGFNIEKSYLIRIKSTT